jgi:hypothetical protein
MGAAVPGTVYIYALSLLNPKNQEFTLTLGDLGAFPVDAEFALTEMQITGRADSETKADAPNATEGNQGLVDIEGRILKDGDTGDIATFRPYSEVGNLFNCFQLVPGLPLGIPVIYTGASLSDGDWTGLCNPAGTGVGNQTPFEAQTGTAPYTQTSTFSTKMTRIFGHFAA